VIPARGLRVGKLQDLLRAIRESVIHGSIIVAGNKGGDPPPTGSPNCFSAGARALC
jgi:hypothetical protein